MHFCRKATKETDAALSSANKSYILKTTTRDSWIVAMDGFDFDAGALPVV